MWRVTYHRDGHHGWCDFHCELDALAFITWGDLTDGEGEGAFIDAAYHRVGADDGYDDALNRAG